MEELKSRGLARSLITTRCILRTGRRFVLGCSTITPVAHFPNFAGRSFRGARNLIKELPPADCIVIIEEGIILGMALLSMLRFTRTPIVCITCRLSMRLPKSPLARLLTTFLLRATHTVFLSRMEADILPKQFSLRNNDYSYNSFGVDASFGSRPSARGNLFLLSAIRFEITTLFFALLETSNLKSSSSHPRISKTFFPRMYRSEPGAGAVKSFATRNSANWTTRPSAS